jgi:hypothetical protein
LDQRWSNSGQRWSNLSQRWSNSSNGQFRVFPEDFAENWAKKIKDGQISALFRFRHLSSSSAPFDCSRSLADFVHPSSFRLHPYWLAPPLSHAELDSGKEDLS